MRPAAKPQPPQAAEKSRPVSPAVGAQKSTPPLPAGVPAATVSAVELMGSVSRVAPDVNPPEVQTAGARFRELLADYRRAEDLINIGAYAQGSNATVDQAIALMDQMNAYLRQPFEEGVDLEGSRQQLLALAAQAG